MKPNYKIDFLGCYVGVLISEARVIWIEDNAQITECPRCGCSLLYSYRMLGNDRIRCKSPNCDTWRIEKSF